jgi:hypothetical protein
MLPFWYFTLRCNQRWLDYLGELGQDKGLKFSGFSRPRFTERLINEGLLLEEVNLGTIFYGTPPYENSDNMGLPYLVSQTIHSQLRKLCCTGRLPSRWPLRCRDGRGRRDATGRRVCCQYAFSTPMCCSLPSKYVSGGIWIMSKVLCAPWNYSHASGACIFISGTSFEEI